MSIHFLLPVSFPAMLILSNLAKTQTICRYLLSVCGALTQHWFVFKLVSLPHCSVHLC